LQDFKQLQVWRKAHALALSVYRATRTDPGRHRAELVGQARRAALSVAANIAEGAGRGSGPDFARFLAMSIGSANELESHILIGYGAGLIRRQDAVAITNAIREVRRTLVARSRSVRRATKPQ
jgi:four helix bundle protein